MASPATPVLLCMLEPWLARARTHVKISLDAFASASDVARDLWICWELPTDGLFEVEDAETMELLELFARVDYKTAWKAVLEMTNNAVYLNHVLDFAIAGEPLYLRYKVNGLQHAFAKSTLKQTMRWVLFNTDTEEYSPAYYAVRQMLRQCWADRHHHGRVPPYSRGLGDRIQIHFDLDVSPLDQEVASSFLEEIAIIARLIRYPSRMELYQSWQHPPGQRIAKPSEIFMMDSVYVRLESVEATDAMLRTLQGFWTSYGIRVDGIYLGELTPEASPSVL